MKALADCIQPDTVIFTNIGDAHSEGFASMEEKAKEKALLASGPSTRNIICNADSPLLLEALAPYRPEKSVITWSINGSDADISVSCDSPRDKGLSDVTYTYKGASHSIKAPVVNRTDLENTASALHDS